MVLKKPRPWVGIVRTRITQEEKRKFRSLAKREGRMMSEILTTMIRCYIRQQESQS